MADKKVHFVKVNLRKRMYNTNEDYHLIKTLLQDIIAKEGANTEDSISIDLTPEIHPDDIEPKIFMDVYDNDDLLFARVCKKKPNNVISRRDYSSYKSDEVFSAEDSKKYGIEVFTFLMLDYQHGILSIASSKDAPGASILNCLFDCYDNRYTLEFTSIPNKDGIDMVYKADKPQITEYKFIVPVPDARYLQDVLGMSEEEIESIVNEHVHSATVILKPYPRQSIENNVGKVKQIIDILKERGSGHGKTVLKAKTEEFTTTEFDLQDQFFSYPIEIRKYKVINKEKYAYTLKEMREQFRTGIYNAYNKHKELILAIAGREENI